MTLKGTFDKGGNISSFRRSSKSICRKVTKHGSLNATSKDLASSTIVSVTARPFIKIHESPPFALRRSSFHLTKALLASSISFDNFEVSVKISLSLSEDANVSS